MSGGERLPLPPRTQFTLGRCTTEAERDSYTWIMEFQSNPPRVADGDLITRPVAQFCCRKCGSIIAYADVYDTRARLPQFGTVFVFRAQYPEGEQMREVPIPLTGRTDLPKNPHVKSFCPKHGWSVLEATKVIEAIEAGIGKKARGTKRSRGTRMRSTGNTPTRN